MSKFLVSLIGLLIATSAAQACRVQNQPFRPATMKSDVIVTGRVFDVQRDGDLQSFSVKVESVLSGQFPAPTYSTGWSSGIGGCGPRGPEVEEDDQVVVYFRIVDGKPVEQGWTKTGVPDIARLSVKTRVR